MTKFGGNEFSSFSVPLVFDGRYFVLESGESALLSVFTEQDGEAVFEVLKNAAVSNPVSDSTSNQTGIVTVSEKATGRFLYKVRPDSETSIAFGKLDGGEISARISDRSIQVGDMSIVNIQFNGAMAGVVVEPNGKVAIGGPIPSAVLRLLQGDG